MSNINFSGENVIQFVIALLVSALLFLRCIVYIAEHPKRNTTLLKWLFVGMFFLGMVTYCFCHYRELEEVVNGSLKSNSLGWVQDENASWIYKFLYVVIQSAIDVGTMFSGRGNNALFYSLPESKNPLIVFLFSALHAIAFFTTSSALLIRFGEDFLRRFRRLIVKISDVDLIFGVTSDSIAFGKNIVHKNGSMPVYVDSMVGENYERAIHNLGGLVYSDTDALKVTRSFLEELRIVKQKTKLRLYALSKEHDKNLQYAKLMSDALEKLHILPEQTELLLLGTDEQKGLFFQANKKQYGYGNVLSFDEFEITARLLINEYPPCNAIDFDKDGRALNDMEVLLVGFGRIGHAVLRKIIANGQFEGSNFHATIYDPKYEERKGFFRSQYPLMFADENYLIDFNFKLNFESQDGRSYDCFNYLQEKASELRYIVICFEDSETARDLAIRMVDCLQATGYSQNVYTCDSKSVRCYSPNVQDCKTHWIYDSDLLYSKEFDRYAMALHHHYCRQKAPEKSLEENWKECCYFHRMSNRASVDYLIPLIRKIKAVTKTDTLTQAQKENLARNEHLRWWAFHCTFGYEVMEHEEFIQRLEDQQAEIKKFGNSEIKPTHDMKSRKHACLVSWDELDEISRIENSVTHGNKNYKDLDRGSVDTIIELIQNEQV